MNNQQLSDKAATLLKASRAINHPLLPSAAKALIASAAEILAELVSREVKRNAKGE